MPANRAADKPAAAPASRPAGAPAGARVVGLATEAQVRADLGLPADLRWLRVRRRDLVAALLADLA